MTTLEQSNGKVIRHLAHRLLSDDECRKLKTALKSFRTSRSVTSLVTQLKPLLNTPEKASLLVEIGYMLPVRLQEDYNNLCKMQFKHYLQMNRTSHTDSKSKDHIGPRIIAQNHSGTMQVLQTGSQKNFIIMGQDVVPLQDIRLSDFEKKTKEGRNRSLKEHAKAHQYNMDEKTGGNVELLRVQWNEGATETNPEKGGIKSFFDNLHKVGSGKTAVKDPDLAQTPRSSREAESQIKTQRVVEYIRQSSCPSASASASSSSTASNGCPSTRSETEYTLTKQTADSNNKTPRERNRCPLNPHPDMVLVKSSRRDLMRRFNSRTLRAAGSSSDSEEAASSQQGSVPETYQSHTMPKCAKDTKETSTATIERRTGTYQRARNMSVRKIVLVRNENESLGLSIRGGSDVGAGIFVVDLDSGGQAENQGLKVGDRILKVNDTSFRDITHGDAVKVIQACDRMVISVTSSQGHKMPGRRSSVGSIQAVSDSASQVKEVTLTPDPDGWLGCTIRGGIDYDMDVIFSNVDRDSPAFRAGLKKGDVIINMNGIEMAGFTHMQVVTLATSFQKLNLVVKPRVRGNSQGNKKRATSLSREAQEVAAQAAAGRAHSVPDLCHAATASETQQQQGTCSTDHHGNQGPPTAASPSSSLRGRRTDMLRFEEELQKTPPVSSSTPVPPLDHVLRLGSPISVHSDNDSSTDSDSDDPQSFDLTLLPEISILDNNQVPHNVDDHLLSPNTYQGEKKTIKRKSSKVNSGTIRLNLDKWDKNASPKFQHSGSSSREDMRNVFSGQPGGADQPDQPISEDLSQQKQNVFSSPALAKKSDRKDTETSDGLVMNIWGSPNGNHMETISPDGVVLLLESSSSVDSSSQSNDKILFKSNNNKPAPSKSPASKISIFASGGANERDQVASLESDEEWLV